MEGFDIGGGWLRRDVGVGCVVMLICVKGLDFLMVMMLICVKGLDFLLGGGRPRMLTEDDVKKREWLMVDGGCG